jgi:hypothetical protein
MHDTIQGRCLFDAQAWLHPCATESEKDGTTLLKYSYLSLLLIFMNPQFLIS